MIRHKRCDGSRRKGAGRGDVNRRQSFDCVTSRMGRTASGQQKSHAVRRAIDTKMSRQTGERGIESYCWTKRSGLQRGARRCTACLHLAPSSRCGCKARSLNGLRGASKGDLFTSKRALFAAGTALPGRSPRLDPDIDQGAAAVTGVWGRVQQQCFGRGVGRRHFCSAGVRQNWLSTWQPRSNGVVLASELTVAAVVA